MKLEELKKSKEEIGDIFPVIKSKDGEIIDGFHRKRADSDWKEETVDVEDKLDKVKLRVHLNLNRRSISKEEKKSWVKQARKALQKRGKKGTQEEIAETLGMSESWVRKYDDNPTENHKTPKKGNSAHRAESDRPTYNVWGFENNDWQKDVSDADPNQPDADFYHGMTPAFVIENLIKLYEPNRVLDSMAGVGTTGFVCDKLGVDCELYDIYPYPKSEVKKGDAEKISPEGRFDLIFNHIPYLNMVQYGDDPNDLSNLDEQGFFKKLEKIFKNNHHLLKEDGVYAVLIGDWRREGRLIPLTDKTTLLGLNNGFKLQDKAIKLTKSQQSSGLQEHRARKFGYLAQTFDTILVFKKEGLV